MENLLIFNTQLGNWAFEPSTAASCNWRQFSGALGQEPFLLHEILSIGDSRNWAESLLPPTYVLYGWAMTSPLSSALVCHQDLEVMASYAPLGMS